MALLEYENEIFLDCFHEDGLLIMAKWDSMSGPPREGAVTKTNPPTNVDTYNACVAAGRGLGIERVFGSFLKLYCDEGSLVLVLNVIQNEEEFFLDFLKSSGVDPLPRVINSSCGTNERHDIYLEGGVLFITARILVVDMLVERIPIHLISGILVYRAHKVIDSCQEAFILRLYREKNKTGFIKAFSDHPHCFTSGFCQVERVMKSLFVRKLYLWPRFHASVVAFYEKHKIDVVELHLQMTDSMTSCQTALVDLIDACVKELKRSNAVLESEDINVEYALTRNFERAVRLQLDPVWHQLSSKTKQLVADLKTLSTILEYLTQYDCVNFYSLVNALKTNEKTFGSNAGWLFMDSAENLFVHAKERLSATEEPSKKKTRNSAETADESRMEECPKWSALREVLEEIEVDCRSADQEFQSVRILIVAHDDRTCSQIKSYLCEGGQPLLKRLYEQNLAVKSAPLQQPKSSASVSMEKNKVKNTKQKKTNVLNRSPAELTLTQMVVDKDPVEAVAASDDPQPANVFPFESVDHFKSAYRVNELPLTFLHPIRDADDPTSLTRILYELKPRFVVLYDAEMAFVRQLEVFKACNPLQPIRIYFLMYAGSTEEQKYLTTLRKEKEAFEHLIKQKAVMVIPEEREGRMEDDPELERNTAPANATVNTRKGGAAEFGISTIPQKIIVDMREFRSELPSLIHKRGIDIEPLTLEVGDYILTKDICVERKSVSDLIGSLNNGRLFNQCQAMCRTYKRPVLLIEFDANKPFTLQDRYPISKEMNNNDTISRLVLLTIHFPRLRILWCQSPFVTAELFQELKVGRDQPDASDALAASDADQEKNIGRYNPGPYDMLLKMPGITSKNAFAIANHVENVAQLARLSVERLTELLGSSISANQLYEFLHKELQDQPNASAAGQVVKQKPGRMPLKRPEKKR